MVKREAPVRGVTKLTQVYRGSEPGDLLHGSLRAGCSRRRCSAPQILEAHIHDRILLPVLVIEMPPFVGINKEAFSLHRPTQNRTMLTLLRSSTGIVGKGSLRDLVINAGHRDFASSFQVADAEIDGAAAIVLRASRRIGDEDLPVVRCRVPEHLG